METMPKRKYSMSDGNLRQLANDFAMFATRDLTQLAKYNITAARIDTLNDLADAFNALPSDVVLRTDLKYATIAKNVKEKEISDIIGNIRTRAQIVFGVGSMQFNDFHFEEAENASDKELFTCAAVVISAATRHLTALSNYGQTASEITDLETKSKEYVTAVTTIRSVESNRRNAKKNRVIAGNALYDAIGDIAAAGKSVFADTDPAKYPDYLLHPGADVPQSPAPKPSNVHYATPYMSWNESSTALYYYVEVSNDGGATYTMYEDNIEDTQIEVEVPSQGSRRYRVVAVNAAGDSEPSNYIVLSGTPVSPADINYANDVFTISEVQDAEEYQILYGTPGGSVNDPSTTEVSVSPSNVYAWHFPLTGAWVFYVRVKVGGQWSGYLVKEMTFV